MEARLANTNDFFYPYLLKGKSKELLNLTRKQSRRIIEKITGQNRLHYINNKVTGQELLCRFCKEEEETFDHLFLKFLCFDTQRRERNLTYCGGTHR